MAIRDTKNTSYKVHIESCTDERIEEVNIEQGALMVSETGLYMGHNGENVRVYPQSASSQGLGWARYDDGIYTALNKLQLADGVETTLTNNGANIVRSKEGVNYYNPSTNKMVADTMSDVYIMTIVFNYSAPNANQTFIHLNLDNVGATPYSRLKQDIAFPKGNDVQHEYHGVFQYYVDADFISNGASWKLTAEGGTAQVWDIIFFIQKTQSYA